MTRRILFVDDEAPILSALSRSLRSQAYDIVTTTDARAALEVSRQVKVDVVISDYRMPGMNGVELLAAFKEEQPGIVRMMLSGEADREAVLASINEAAIFRFLVKPWDDETLFQAVADACWQRRLNEEMDTALCDHRKRVSGDYRRRQALEQLEEETPGITRVNWSSDDTIIIEDEWELEDAI